MFQAENASSIKQIELLGCFPLGRPIILLSNALISLFDTQSNAARSVDLARGRNIFKTGRFYLNFTPRL